MLLKKRKSSLPEVTAIKRVAVGALATGAFATGAFATGARAIGAFAIGAFAVGSFAIRRLAIRSVLIQSLEVDDLRVSQFPAAKMPRPKTGFVITHFLTVSDVQRSAEFYTNVLDGEVVLAGEPSVVKLANSWIILNVGGGPTDDKPDVVLHPPTSSREVSSFLNIRVSDIKRSYGEWKRKGAQFLTEPKEHENEIRCYMKDPDGYLIEVGQTTALDSEFKKVA
jgi:catechol 2,3-dioxygenase-like lactoylglutathione lyase family enzyme